MDAAETTDIRTRIYRGVEIQFWKSGDRWFAFAPGQKCDNNGHPTLTVALEHTEKFVDQTAKPH